MNDLDHYADQLQRHVDKLNNYVWVRDSGKPYFVAKRERADGTVERYVDRRG